MILYQHNFSLKEKDDFNFIKNFDYLHKKEEEEKKRSPKKMKF